MNYDQLFAFVAFAEHLSFTHAAKRLHVSQPALHVQIRKLGESVGRPLYRREGRSLVLTPEGERLAAFGREVADRGRAVLEELRGEPLSGPVVLASGQGAFLYLLGPAIRRFQKERWPLRLLSYQGPQAVEAVRDARAHLCVVATETAPPDLYSTALRSVGQIVVLPSSHRLARRRSLRPGDLNGEPIIVAPAGSPHRTMLAETLRSGGAEWSVAVETTGWELMIHFAQLGLGIAVVNDFCRVPKGMAGIPLEGAASITYWLIARSSLMSQGTLALHHLITTTVS